MPTVLNGNRTRDEILSECRPRVEALCAARDLPGLAVVLVGHNPSSEVYVRNKIRACQALGIYSEKLTPPEDATTEDLIAAVESLNARPEIDSMLVQLPLPPHVNAKKVLLAIKPEKDADGLHPLNLGRLVANMPGPRPCTPAGVIELLKRYRIPIAGKHAVVVGRSDIVGKPMAMLLLHEHATVTICHSRTADLPAITRQADVLVAAVGRAGLIGPGHVSPGATVIDVGTNPTADGGLAGDVDPAVASVAAALTPVPGGVGPVTTALLLSHVVRAATG